MLNYEFPPLGGGAGNATFYLLKEFAKNKDIVIDLVTSSTGSFKKENFSKNITIYKLNIGKNNQLLRQSFKDLLVYSWKAYKYSKKLISQKKYNLIHAFFGIPCGYIAYKLKIPYIVSLRGSDVPGHNPKFNIIYFLLGSLIKKVWKNATFLIANSQDLRRTALAFYHQDYISVIPNGIDSKKFFPNNKKSFEKTTKFLYAGRLNKIKGIDVLLEAFDQYSQKNKWCTLTIIGDGPLNQSLQNKYKLNFQIIFLGRKNPEEMPNIYRNHDIFILPSLNEGMSNTILEAMASGLPIITTDTGGNKQLIKNNGLIIPKNDITALKQAFEKFYDNHQLINSMGQQSRQLAIYYDWSNTAKDYLKKYLVVKKIKDENQ